MEKTEWPVHYAHLPQNDHKQKAMYSKEKEMTEKEALLKLCSLCAKAEHCTGEMRQKMNSWGIDPDTQQRIIDRLLAEKYIDDERYTRAFVSDKMAYNKWGRRKIEQELYRKGVSKDIADTVLNEVNDEEYIDILRPMLRNKLKTISARNDYERSMKLMRYAMGRGFELHIVRQCIDHADDRIDD